MRLGLLLLNKLYYFTSQGSGSTLTFKCFYLKVLDTLQMA